jgi:hypothetical protein
MNKKDWYDSPPNTSYYYTVQDGRIIGQIYNLAHTKIYGAKVFSKQNEERYLGQFISNSFAMKAVEDFWSIQERTLPNEIFQETE